MDDYWSKSLLVISQSFDWMSIYELNDAKWLLVN